MEVVNSSFLPGDPRLIDHIVYELKSQGIFDNFRKECIADVDTKPAYQNLRQRVEGSVSSFLKTQKWRPDMNKNHVREMLRKNISESGFLETGVERIVDQVVNPKINSIFLPQVENVVYKVLGIEKPTSFDDLKKEGKAESCPMDLLPNDLEAVSPESEPQDKKPDTSSDSKIDDKVDEDESPPFEPLEEGVPMEENSIDSNLSGISGLVSHDSNHSIEAKPIPMETSNQDSQFSKQSSDDRLSIVMSDDQEVKIETNEDSNTSTNKAVAATDVPDSSADKNQLQEKTDEHEKSEEKRNDNKRSDKHRSSSSSHKHSSHRSRHDSSRDHNKDRKSDRDKKDHKSRSSEDSKRDKDKDKKERSRSSRDDKSSSKSSKERERTSSSSKHKKRNSEHKDDKARSESKDPKSRDRSKEDSKSKSHSSKKTDSKTHSKHNGKSKTDSKSSSKDGDKKNDSNKHRKDDGHSSEKKNDKYKDKKNSKDRKKDKDDHYSLKEKKSNRRSTDRDSSDGHSGTHSSSSSYTELTTPQVQKSQESSLVSGSSSGGDSGNSDAVLLSHNLNISSIPCVLSEEEHSQIIASVPHLKLIKPKFASNIFEARRLMKIRKKLSKLEKQKQMELMRLNSSLNSIAASKYNNHVKPPIENENNKKKHTNNSHVKSYKYEEGSHPTNDEGSLVEEVQISDDTELKTAVISKESWDAIEAKLNAQNILKVDYNSYTAEVKEVKPKVIKPETDSRGFFAQEHLQTSRRLDVVWKIIQDLELSLSNICKGYVPQLRQVDEINKLPKVDIVDVTSNNEVIFSPGQGIKRISADHDVRNNNKVNKEIGNAINNRINDRLENYDPSSNPTPKTKKSKLMDTSDNFNLPLSPAESDKSFNSVGDKKVEVLEGRGKRNRAISNQRYSSDDLYKPRMQFTSKRRRTTKNLDDN